MVRLLGKAHVCPCRVPARTYSMHGGAGALISVGLFRKVSYDHMHRCVQGAYSSGGDAFITECIWDVRSSPGHSPVWIHASTVNVSI